MTKKAFRMVIAVILMTVIVPFAVAQRAVRPPPAFVGTWHIDFPMGHGVRAAYILEIGSDGSVIWYVRFSNLTASIRHNVPIISALERLVIISTVTSASNSEITVVSNDTGGRETFRLVGQSLVTYNFNGDIVRYTRGQPPSW